MTATFYRHGEGRSIAAREAEANGRMPMSRAKKVVADRLGCTQAVAAAALELLHDGEWHHVGKFASQVGYYDSADCLLAGAAHHIIAAGGVKKFTERREALRRSRRQNQPITWTRSTGRVLTMQAYRRRVRGVVAQILGAAASAAPWRGRRAFVELGLGEASWSERTIVALARAAGWADGSIALAIAEGGYAAETIIRFLTD